MVSRRTVGAALALAVTVSLAACAPDEAPPTPSRATVTPATTERVRTPPATGAFDYQLDEAYRPASGVTVVVRDREARAPATGYGVCYVNAFQTQPQDRSSWLRDRSDLVLRDDRGRPVEDPGWPGELLLDIGTESRRAAAAAVLDEQLDTCVRNGFAAVELDNLDSWTRSRGRLTATDAMAFATLLVQGGHSRGLAVAQKNAAELLGADGLPAFDLAVTEDCGTYDECSQFTGVYGRAVFDVEYTDAGFATACASEPSLRVVRRDLELAAPGSPGHVLRHCPAR